MTKKFFGKRFVAMLTTLAILISMVAMIGSFAVSAETTPYTPKRTMSYTAGGTQIEGKMLITTSGTTLGAGKNVTVSGYYKVENYVAKNDTDHCVQIGNWNNNADAISVKADCDWTPFSINYTTGDSNWLKFGFWYAQGTVSIADIVIKEGDTVLYDMTTDANLIAGTYDASKQPSQLGMWYIGYYGEKSEISCTIDPVYTEPYAPKRTMSYTAGGTQIEGKMLITTSGTTLGAGKNVTVSGYYKVENYVAKNDTDHCVQIGNWNNNADAISVKADCDWTPFSINYTTGDSNWLKFGFWYAQGTVSIADIVIKEGDTVLYDMTTDANLIAGTYDASKQPSQLGMWYIGYYGEKSEISCTIDPVYTEPYAPKRTMSYTAGGTQIEGKMLITTSGTTLGAGKNVTVSGYYKVENYVAKNDTDHCVQIGNWNNNADAISVKADCDWTPFSINYTTGDSNWLKFGFWYAQGTVSIADIVIKEGDTVLYDMTTDANLIAGTYDASKQPSQLGMWYIGYYGEKSEISCTIDPVYTEPYAPKRTMSYTAGGTQIEGKMLITTSGTTLGAGKNVTVSGYYKVENYVAKNDTDHCVQIGNWNNNADAISVKADCDWTPFSINYTTGDSNWLKFGFWYAQGTVSIADIVIKEGDTVLYDMTTDANLIAGTYDASKQPSQLGMWYIGYYGEKSEISCTIDPVYVPEVYTPSRVISMTTAGTQINGKIYLYHSNLLGVGKEVTAKGYYKVENYTVADATQNPKIISAALGDITADCDWTPFEITFTTAADTKVLDLEFWYTQGTVSFADVTIAEADGTYIYDMTSDEDLVAGTYDSTNWLIDQSIWYFGFYAGIDAATYTVGEKVDGGIVVIPPPFDPQLVELPTIPDMIVADSEGYTPNRAFGIINRKEPLAKAYYTVWAEDYFLDSEKYYIFANVKVSNFEAFASATDAACQIDMLAGENNVVLGKWTANTDGWVALKNADGTPISFDKLTVEDSFVLNFSVKNAAADFMVADLIIADAEGNVIYSLANDKTLNASSDLRYVALPWKAEPYVGNIEGPTLFPVQTKDTTPYVPNKTISITQDNFQKGHTAESFLFLRTNNAAFTVGKTYTITGMIKVDIDKGYGGWGNPALSISDSGGQAMVADSNILDTNGRWVTLTHGNGSPLTFKATADEDWVKLNLFKTYGTISLADIVITDSEGNVVYSFETDDTLVAGTFDGNVASVGNVFLHALYGNGTGAITVNANPVVHTAADYQIPTFVETVEVPKIEEEPTPVPPAGDNTLLGVLVALMAVSALAIVTLKKKEF